MGLLDRWREPKPADARETERLVRTIERSCGLVVDEWRIRRALDRLGPSIDRAGSIGAYADRVQRDLTARQEMIEALCVHETSFFRHPRHFELLAAFLRESIPSQAAGVNAWSVAASSGEEPYSIALTILEHTHRNVAMRSRVLGTDISRPVLDRARKGVYPGTHASQIERPVLERHFLRGVGDAAGSMRINGAARDLVEFQRLNLVDRHWPIEGEFDAVFCRNVLIYFGPEQRRQIAERVGRRVRIGGMFFLGPSENAKLSDERFEKVEPAVYRRVR